MQTNSSLQWEIDWIRKNVKQYDSVLHSESVIENISKGYRLREFLKLLENPEIIAIFKRMAKK